MADEIPISPDRTCGFRTRGAASFTPREPARIESSIIDSGGFVREKMTQERPMFGFLRTPVPRSPSAAIAHVVEQAGLPADIKHSSMLRVVESRGRYSGRRVLFVRVFDPARVAACAVAVQRFSDLDEYPSLVLWSGHVERDGSVAITRGAAAIDTGAPTRVHADRTAHADDERFVFNRREAAAQGVTS